MSINSSNFHPAFNFQEAYDRHPCEVGKEKSNLDDLHPASSNFFLYHTNPLYNMGFSMVSKDSNLMLIEDLAIGLVKKGFKEEVVETIAKATFSLNIKDHYTAYPSQPTPYDGLQMYGAGAETFEYSDWRLDFQQDEQDNTEIFEENFQVGASTKSKEQQEEDEIGINLTERMSFVHDFLGFHPLGPVKPKEQMALQFHSDQLKDDYSIVLSSIKIATSKQE